MHINKNNFSLYALLLICSITCAKKSTTTLEEYTPTNLKEDLFFKKIFNKTLSEKEKKELKNPNAPSVNAEACSIWNSIENITEESSLKLTFQLIDSLKEKSSWMSEKTTYVGKHLPGKIPQLNWFNSDEKESLNDRELGFENVPAWLERLASDHLAITKEAPGIISGKAGALDKSYFLKTLMRDYFPEYSEIKEFSIEELEILEQGKLLHSSNGWKQQKEIVISILNHFQNVRIQKISENKERICRFALNQYLTAFLIHNKGIFGAPKVSEMGSYNTRVHGVFETEDSHGAFYFRKKGSTGDFNALILEETNVEAFLKNIENYDYSLSNPNEELKNILDLLQSFIAIAKSKSSQNPIWIKSENLKDANANFFHEQLLQVAYASLLVSEKLISERVLVYSQDHIEHSIDALETADLTKLLESVIDAYTTILEIRENTSKTQEKSYIKSYIENEEKKGILNPENIFFRIHYIFASALGEARTRVRDGNRNKNLIRAIYKASL